MWQKQLTYGEAVGPYVAYTAFQVGSTETSLGLLVTGVSHPAQAQASSEA